VLQRIFSMALPELETDANATPMIPSDCTCCDWCAYCGGMDHQGEISAVLHGRNCPWMAKRLAAGMLMKDGYYNHKFLDDPEVVVVMERLAARVRTWMEA